MNNDHVITRNYWMAPEKGFDKMLFSDWHKFLFSLNSGIVNCTHDFFRSKGFSPALMPVTCGAISSPMGPGSDSLPVKIKLFDEEIYLADSMQFVLEYHLRHGTEGVFYIMPTFRGENPDSTHLNQFFHAEVEAVCDLSQIMSLVEEYVSTLALGVLDSIRRSSISSYLKDDHLIKVANEKREFSRISFSEAVEHLRSNRGSLEKDDVGSDRITKYGEMELVKMNNGEPLWLLNPPSKTVPFYQAQNPDQTAKCADLLFKFGEVVGCGERHSNSIDAFEALSMQGVSSDEYKWYLRMKELTPMSTSGFGLGIERFLMWALDHDEIRDLHILPRLKGSKYIF